MRSESSSVHLNVRKEFRVGAQELVAAEKRFQESVGEARRLLSKAPAEARPGEGCGYCPARPRCGVGWRAYPGRPGPPAGRHDGRSR